MPIALYRTFSGEGFWFDPPFDRATVAELLARTGLPPDAYRWSAARRLWWVQEQHLHRVRFLMETLGRVVEMHAPLDDWSDDDGEAQGRYGRSAGGWWNTWNSTGSKQEQASHLQGPSTDPHATLHLLPTAPWEVVKATHRALTLLHHPDQGGDEETMRQINLAFEKIQKERRIR